MDAKNPISLKGRFKKTDGRFIILYVLSLALAFIMLMPTMGSGYMYDDSFDSLVKGKAMEMGISIPQYANTAIHSEMCIGRFFPIQLTYMWFLYYIVDDLTTYKLIKIIFILFDVIAFSYLVMQLTGSGYMGILSVLITPVFFQVRTFYDAILAFNLHLPLVTLFTFLSIILLIHYLRDKKILYLPASVFFYAASLLTYEIAYAFIPIHIAVAYLYTDRDIKKTFRVFLPYAAILFIVVLISIYLRLTLGVSMIGGTDSGSYVPNPDIAEYARTVINQLFATIPFSYYVTAPRTLIPENIRELARNMFILIPVAIGSFILCRATVIKAWSIKGKEKNSNALALTVIIGLLLWILPSVIISLSPRYQKDVYFGVAYLPVYVSYFGAMLILLTSANWIVNRYTINKKMLTTLALVAALAIACANVLTYDNTGNVVEKLNLYFKYPRDIIESAHSNGLFKDVPSGSVLFIDNEYPWDQRAFYLTHDDGNFSYVGGGNISRGYGGSAYVLKDAPVKVETLNSTFYSYEFTGPKNAYYLNYGSLTGDYGYAVFAKLCNITVTDGKIIDATATDAFLYVNDPSSGATKTYTAIGSLDDDNVNLSDMRFISSFNRTDIISSDADWYILKISRESHAPFNLKSMFIYDSPGVLEGNNGSLISDNHAIIFDTADIRGPYDTTSGWYPSENWGGVSTRWMENNAKVMIYSDDNRTANLTLSAISYNRTRNLCVYVNGELSYRVNIGYDAFYPVSTPIALKKGINIIVLNTPEGSDYPRDPSGRVIERSRRLSLAVGNINITGNEAGP